VRLQEPVLETYLEQFSQIQLHVEFQLYVPCVRGILENCVVCVGDLTPEVSQDVVQSAHLPKHAQVQFHRLVLVDIGGLVQQEGLSVQHVFQLDFQWKVRPVNGVFRWGLEENFSQTLLSHCVLVEAPGHVEPRVGEVVREYLLVVDIVLLALLDQVDKVARVGLPLKLEVTGGFLLKQLEIGVEHCAVEVVPADIDVDGTLNAGDLAIEAPVAAALFIVVGVEEGVLEEFVHLGAFVLESKFVVGGLGGKLHVVGLLLRQRVLGVALLRQDHSPVLQGVDVVFAFGVVVRYYSQNA